MDFVVVPGVFRNINDFFEAGNLGVYLFTKLNSLEVVISASVLAVLVFIFRKNPRALPLLISGIIVTIISLIYFTYLIPKIAYLSELWKLSDSGKIIETFDIQQEHQYFHRIYIIMDTVKIFILSFMIISAVSKEKWTA